MNKDELIVKICKRVIVVFGVLAVFNFILLINNKSYALFTKTITSDKTVVHIETADRFPILTGPSTDVIKDTVVSNVTDTCTEPDFETEGGLVAINTEGTLYQENSDQEIREYRYVGPNVKNYIYFNCQDNVEPSSDTCEVWRILGIFKDEEGQEHIKIVKNETLKGDMMPSTYSVENGTTYNIRNGSYNNAFWNNKVNGTYNNDWATAGLQYWLNSGEDSEEQKPEQGYLSYLSKNAKNMISKTKYYLGNVRPGYNGDTAIISYTHERGNTSCIINEEGEETCSGGDIWEENQAEWNGKIALMYPSDYGYTANSCNWSGTTLNDYRNGAKSTSWLYKTANHDSQEWLLSPYFSRSNYVARWYTDGEVTTLSVNPGYGQGVRPTLYLTSQVQIVDGDGSSETPYVISIE